MRKSKTVYILLGVLAVLCIGAFAVSKIEAHKEDIRSSGEVFLSIDPEEVTALSWSVSDAAYSFTKGDGWIYDADAAFPVNEEKISELLEIFRDFSASFVIEDAEDLSQYGLNRPEGTITITTAAESYTILLGDYSTIDAQRYVSIGDGRVYLVTYDPTEDFSIAISDLILNDTVPDFSSVSSVSFTGSQSYTFRYQEESTDSYCAEDVYFVGSKPLDTDAVEAYLSTVRYLSLEDYATYSASESDLEAFYLENPALTVTVNYIADETGDEGSFIFSVGCDPEALAEAEEAEDTEATVAYLRVGSSSIIYRLSAYEYHALMACGYDDLRHSDIVSADFDTVYQMDITLEGKTYTLVRDEDAEDTDEDNASVWNYGDESADIEELSSAIGALTADSFTDTAEAGKQEIALTLYLRNEQFPTVSIVLCRYNGTSCVAKVDGKVTALVPRSQVVDLIEAVNGIVL